MPVCIAGHWDVLLVLRHGASSWPGPEKLPCVSRHALTCACLLIMHDRCGVISSSSSLSEFVFVLLVASVFGLCCRRHRSYARLQAGSLSLLIPRLLGALPTCVLRPCSFHSSAEMCWARAAAPDQEVWCRNALRLYTLLCRLCCNVYTHIYV